MGGVFINYRSEDSETTAALIDRELAARFGSDRVFLDNRSIPAGADFVEELLAQLRACSVLLVVIGRHWLTLTDATGQRRIDDPADWVRREIAEALSLGLRVIPVLTDGVALPAEADLPEDIAGLSRRQYVPLRGRYTTVDLPILVEQITEVDTELAKVAAQRRSSTGPVPRQLMASPRLFTMTLGALAIITLLTAAIIHSALSNESPQGEPNSISPSITSNSDPASATNPIGTPTSPTPTSTDLAIPADATPPPGDTRLIDLLCDQGDEPRLSTLDTTQNPAMTWTVGLNGDNTIDATCRPARTDAPLLALQGHIKFESNSGGPPCPPTARLSFAIEADGSRIAHGELNGMATPSQEIRASIGMVRQIKLIAELQINPGEELCLPLQTVWESPSFVAVALK